MTTTNGYQLTANESAVIVKMQEILRIEENNNFANGDLWNEISDKISDIEINAEKRAKEPVTSYSDFGSNYN
jgi:hypothetical protein